MSAETGGHCSSAGAGHSLRTGFIAGLLNGLIGIGGGIVIVPAMVARGASPQAAVGTSLAAVVVLSSIAFVAHASFTGMLLGSVGLVLVVVSGMAGAVIGGWILSFLSVHRMMLLFAVMVFALSVRLVLQGVGVGGLEALWPGEPTVAGFVCVGLASGLLSGLFGVGGGALVVLGFAVLFGISVHDGLPVALAVNVTNALAGAVRHALAGRIRAGVVLPMVPAAVVGIGIGTGLALWLPADALRVLFGAFFCFMGVNIARKALAR